MENDSKSILLVEDNADDVALTIRALRSNKIENPIVVAHDGEEALDYVFGTGLYAGRDIDDLPHVILLDLELPKIHGLKVLERIRADDRTKLIPVIVLTGSGSEASVTESYRLGVNSYIIKPVDIDQFIEAVRQLGLYWVITNVSPIH